MHTCTPLTPHCRRQQHPHRQAAKTQVCALTVRHGALAGKSYAYCCRGSADMARHPKQATCCYPPPPHASLPTNHPHSPPPQLTHAPPAAQSTLKGALHTDWRLRWSGRSDTQAEAHSRHASTGNSACAVLFNSPPSTQASCALQRPNTTTERCTLQASAPQQAVCSQPARASLIKRPLSAVPHLLRCQKVFF